MIHEILFVDVAISICRLHSNANKFTARWKPTHCTILRLSDSPAKLDNARNISGLYSYNDMAMKFFSLYTGSIFLVVKAPTAAPRRRTGLAQHQSLLHLLLQLDHLLLVYIH